MQIQEIHLIQVLYCILLSNVINNKILNCIENQEQSFSVGKVVHFTAQWRDIKNMFVSFETKYVRNCCDKIHVRAFTALVLANVISKL